MEWTQTLELAGAPTERDGRAAAAGCWPQSRAEFERLVEAVQDELVHFAYCRLRSVPDAEDVVQDVLVQSYASREKYREVLQVRPYLYRMVSNRCTDLLRKRSRSGLPLDGAAAASIPAAAPSDRPDDALRLRQIELVLSRLPARQAEVMRLRVYAGLPFAAIAETLGASVPTIKSRFRYGVERLRSILVPKEAKR